MTPDELARVPGVPETTLPDEVVQRLPSSSAPAPWATTCRALIWLARATGAAPELPVQARALNVTAGFVTYSETPVGPYHEVFANVSFLHGRRLCQTVPFMAVDSDVSLVGGRANWSLPKTTATFDGTVAHGDGWRVAASARIIGPPLPMRSDSQVVQRFPDGTVRSAAMRMAGRSRAAIVTVDVESEQGLPDWVRPGRHLGAVVDPMTFELAAPTLRSAW